MKKPINSSFHKAPYTKFSTKKTTTEIQFVMDLPKALSKFIGEFFPK